MPADSKIKILFVIDALSFGGGERVFAQIIRRLPPEKYITFLSSLPNKKFYQRLDDCHVKLIPLEFSRQINFPLIFQLRKIIQENKIDIVHGQGARAEFYARIAKMIAGRAKYISSTATLIEEFGVNPVRQKLYQILNLFSAKFVDRFIVVSDYLKKKITNEYNINPKKVVRLYNGIETDLFKIDNVESQENKIKYELKLEKNTKIIGGIGRLAPKKGFEYLIQAIPEVIKANPNMKVLIVGEGPFEDELKAQSSRLKVQNHLIFTGFRSDIKEILSSIDILVIPSLLEGFPMITLEAMAMSKPIVATNIDGISEQIVDGESGILVPSKNPLALAKAIIQLIDNPELARNLGATARENVENNFSVQKMIHETEKIYRSLV